MPIYTNHPLRNERFSFFSFARLGAVSKIVAALVTGSIISIGCSSCGRNSGADSPRTNLSAKEQQANAAQSYEAAKAAAKANKHN